MAAASQIQGLSVSAKPRRFNAEFELILACCKRTNEADIMSLLSPGLDWERVLESAEHHRVVPVMHAVLAGKRAVPSALRVRAHQHAWRALHFSAELRKISQCFERRGIEFMAHKGPALAQLLYGNHALRQFGDLDLLVRTRDVAPATDALIELGYAPHLRLSTRQEQSFLRSGYEFCFGLNSEPHLVELQWQIVPRFCSINFDMNALFSRSARIELDGTPLRTLGSADLLLVLCVHAAKHEWSQLGMLRDIATLAEFDLDWNWIVAEARRLGILKILQVSLQAACKLFTIALSAQLPPANQRESQLVSVVIRRLQQNCETNTESFRYFRDQLHTRERRRDRARFMWRLATTPGIEEWRAVRIPDRYFAMYRVVRIGRLVKRLLT